MAWGLRLERAERRRPKSLNPMPTTATEDPDLMTPDEVAKLLRVTGECVRSWCREGHVDAIRAGKGWRIKRSALFRPDGTLKESIGPNA